MTDYPRRGRDRGPPRDRRDDRDRGGRGGQGRYQNRRDERYRSRSASPRRDRSPRGRRDNRQRSRSPDRRQDRDRRPVDRERDRDRGYDRDRDRAEDREDRRRDRDGEKRRRDDRDDARPRHRDDEDGRPSREVHADRETVRRSPQKTEYSDHHSPLPTRSKAGTPLPFKVGKNEEESSHNGKTRETEDTTKRNGHAMDEDPAEDDDMEFEDGGMAAMQAMMGFGGFGSTKGKKVQGNNVGGIRKEKKTEYRQYMNRVGGFNRPLSPTR